ncbi:hypothetical protein RSOL_389400 [Rhizoctonia solani AG-3 Rhs1AP]|uniref:Arrestin-like N-terminal domain-containing protein n=1 Tax=Rhizoctonia solani AG-3 Rhs1AP TaxID=1086054 RepID=X8JBY6_9AGAM|nr:hypothetical protein RSOL_389400 [Rhizoctonia solani AG-3 Rhs1AP]
MNLVRATPLKLGPTAKTPVGLVKSFPVTAATPVVLDEDLHESGFCIRIKIRNPHPEQPFRTGESVEGHVHIFGRPDVPGSKPNSSPALVLHRLSLRIYFESRTTFWHLNPTNPDRQGKSSIIQRVEKILRHEVHRGVVPLNTIAASWSMDQSVTIPFTEILLGRPHATLGFSFTIPRKMVITETNSFDGAPRGLCSFERCPPPSFREPEGSVEWVAEAIMILANGGPPRVDERMLHVSTSNVAITRLVFPVLPTGTDAGALRDEPFFGNDLGVDPLGSRSRAVRPDYAFTEGVELSNLAEMPLEYYSKVWNLNHSHLIESQVYVPSEAIVYQDSAFLTMRLSLKLQDTPSRNQLFGKFRKSRPVVAKRLCIRLQRSILTRGGKEIKPHTSVVLVRACHLDLDEPEIRVESRGACSDIGVDLLNVTVPFDLQNDGKYLKETAQPMMPVSALVPSFRTPNIQLEYILTISVFFVGDSREHEAARFPLQIKPESATRMAGPRDNPDPISSSL